MQQSRVRISKCNVFSGLGVCWVLTYIIPVGRSYCEAQVARCAELVGVFSARRRFSRRQQWFFCLARACSVASKAYVVRMRQSVHVLITNHIGAEYLCCFVLLRDEYAHKHARSLNALMRASVLARRSHAWAVLMIVRWWVTNNLLVRMRNEHG